MELYIIVFWIICGIGAAMIAGSKNRGAGSWFALGLLFGPIALLIVGFMAPVMVPVEEKEESSNTKKCPYCAEIIKEEAIVCRYCGNEFPTVKSITAEIQEITNERKLNPIEIQSNEIEKWKRGFRKIGWLEKIGKNTKAALSKSLDDFEEIREPLLLVTYADVMGSHIRGLWFNQIDLSSLFTTLIATTQRLIFVQPNKRIVKDIKYKNIDQIKSTTQINSKTYTISSSLGDSAVLEIEFINADDEVLVDTLFERILLLT